MSVGRPVTAGRALGVHDQELVWDRGSGTSLRSSDIIFCIGRLVFITSIYTIHLLKGHGTAKACRVVRYGGNIDTKPEYCRSFRCAL